MYVQVILMMMMQTTRFSSCVPEKMLRQWKNRLSNLLSLKYGKTKFLIYFKVVSTMKRNFRENIFELHPVDICRLAHEVAVIYARSGHEDNEFIAFLLMETIRIMFLLYSWMSKRKKWCQTLEKLIPSIILGFYDQFRGLPMIL